MAAYRELSVDAGAEEYPVLLQLVTDIERIQSPGFFQRLNAQSLKEGLANFLIFFDALAAKYRRIYSEHDS